MKLTINDPINIAREPIIVFSLPPIPNFFSPPYFRPIISAIPSPPERHPIITKAVGQRNPFTDISFKRWSELVFVFGNEIDVLFEIDINDIAKVTVPAITEAILAFREGNVIIKPGGGGRYGRIVFPQEKDTLRICLEPKER